MYSHLDSSSEQSDVYEVSPPAPYTSEVRAGSYLYNYAYCELLVHVVCVCMHVSVGTQLSCRRCVQQVY